MINIFGLKLLTEKDFVKIREALLSVSLKAQTAQDEATRVERVIIEQVEGFMDFVMRRMPLKRSRKEARKYFPKG